MFNQLVTNRDKSPEPLLGTLEHHQTPKAPDSQRCPSRLRKNGLRDLGSLQSH
jgi:hypothetical protein